MFCICVFRYFMVLVQEMAVKIDQGFLGEILAFFTPATNAQADKQKVRLRMQTITHDAVRGYWCFICFSPRLFENLHILEEMLYKDSIRIMMLLIFPGLQGQLTHNCYFFIILFLVYNWRVWDQMVNMRWSSRISAFIATSKCVNNWECLCKKQKYSPIINNSVCMSRVALKYKTQWNNNKTTIKQQITKTYKDI